MVIVLVLVLAIVGIIALFFHMDSVAREVIERGTSTALGVESKTEGVNISLLRQHLRVDTLTIANPEGYRGPLLLETATLTANMRPSTLFSDVIEVPLLEIDGLKLHFEQRDGKNNFTAILENLEERRTDEPRQRFHVDQVIIRDIEAHIEVIEQLGELSRVVVHVPEIVLDDVATDEVEGVAVAELTRRIAPAIVAAVLERGDEIPADVTQLLASNLSELAGKAGGDVARLIGEVGGELGKAIERSVEGLTDQFNRFLNGGSDEGE
ncbi:MAG: AsmA family protein [Phycisphaeraceae bacterium]